MQDPLNEDLRPLLFNDCDWYSSLADDTGDLWVLWRVTKSHKAAWWRDLLSAAAHFAQRHDVLETYKKQFASVPLNSLLDSAGKQENRSSTSPIWEIANELIVGAMLEYSLGWTFLEHDPPGHRGRVGEWLFESPTGRHVFVEVKTLVEPDRYPSVFTRGPATDRLTNLLKGAYRQLPRDGRSTLVVVVGTGLILETSHGIYHGDLFQTLFGRIQFTFQVLPYVEGSERMGPSFHNMFVQQSKHRRLGAVAGLVLGGMVTPGVGLYVIHNPFADQACRLVPDDFPEVDQFWVDEEGMGDEIDGIDGLQRWSRIADRLRK